MNIQDPANPPLKDKDYASNQEVRWCAGCGDYAIIKAVQKTLAAVGAKKENTVFVSGIGCSSRFPYYIDSYGFHGIHGRAPAIASGTLLANPDLDVWVITGDGDGLSIGGNHLLHILRRNFNCQILLFNNGTYALTKGQYSPTSLKGQRSPSSPMGVIDPPLEPAQFAIGAGARFVARAIDTQQKQLVDILTQAYHHQGAAFVEIFQNCVVFNDGMTESFAAKSTASDAQVMLEEGKPLTFGKNGERALKCDPGKLNLKVYDVGGEEDDGHCEILHDPSNRTLAFLLAQLELPDQPLATGIIYNDPSPSYEVETYKQIEQAQENSQRRRMNDVLKQGFTWTI
ncbi:MAG: 2-oxoacid:ferredoxin oxidoreductase subunit beta [Hyphomicrobiales bacterium]|nr:MAG: 2-oxoacid:ferredoxin oxidoreductase subunit beta [Hyphomicrobiales bacterium]